MRATWARKATLRRNGQAMRNVTVTFAIGRYEATIVAAYEHFYRGQFPASRKALVADIEKFLYTKGWPDFMEIEDNPQVDEVMGEAYAIVDRLMPELAEPKVSPQSN